MSTGISDKQVKEAAGHLTGLDDRLAGLVRDRGLLDLEERRRGRPEDPYGALLRSITGQQLSVKAAKAIYTRLIEYFVGSTPAPEQLLAADPEEMRAAAGLSRAKVKFLRSLAEHVIDGSLDLDGLDALSDEDVVAELTEVKGLGVWTAHMFLIFHLGRPDVLPVGDLGVRRGVERLYGLDGLPGPEDMTRLAEPWRPWRSVASLYLWDSLSNAPD
jgi:DNA-3-methyladenine glycosylase II